MKPRIKLHIQEEAHTQAEVLAIVTTPQVGYTTRLKFQVNEDSTLTISYDPGLLKRVRVVSVEEGYTEANGSQAV